jgi:hypothetical protein
MNRILYNNQKGVLMIKMALSTTGKVNKGKFETIISKEIFEIIKGFNWNVQKSNNTNYARRGVRDKANNGEKRKIYHVHRVVWEFYKGPIPEGFTVDHIDGDGLNNLIENLRLATCQEQNMNRRKQSRKASGYIGVRWMEKDKIWAAQIRVSKKGIHLGSFRSAEEAAKARDEAAKIYQGRFAVLNFP